MGNTASQRSQTLQLLSGERFLLCALDFGDVLNHRKCVEGLAVLSTDKGSSQVDPNDLTVLLHVPLLQSEGGYLASEKPIGKRHILSDIIRVRYIGESPLYEFLLAITHHLTKRAVDFQEMIILSDESQTERSLFEYSPETFFTFAQCGLGFAVPSKFCVCQRRPFPNIFQVRDDSFIGHERDTDRKSGHLRDNGQEEYTVKARNRGTAHGWPKVAVESTD